MRCCRLGLECSRVLLRELPPTLLTPCLYHFPMCRVADFDDSSHDIVAVQKIGATAIHCPDRTQGLTLELLDEGLQKHALQQPPGDLRAPGRRSRTKAKVERTARRNGNRDLRVERVERAPDPGKTN